MFLACGNSEKHFLKDEKYRTEVKAQFDERKEMLKSREAELFSVFSDSTLTTEEREALEFLYAYMPLSDLADYDSQFFLNQVRTTFKARDTFDWGKKIPEEVFRHFVLVHRVNNENLDNARSVFFDELKDRVKGMSMEEAALEVNHWCHEKITYRATNRRTSAPLALMKTSWGRCGEQSTFTTMALRAVGIPARQCYTPRWVHSDSNHAWVEAWIDGKWRYLGASEPEAELDVAWFTGPAKRAMLVHTNVFGKYNGPEDKMLNDKLYSIINVLDTYANTRRLKVKVVDPKNNEPVKDASVKFEVYNYAEFSTIANLKTDAEGMVELQTNAEGDLLVWVEKDKLFGQKKIEKDDINTTITLTDVLPSEEQVFVMHVPQPQPIKELTKEQIAENAKRLAHEDSIRNAYMSTFIKEIDAKNFAKKYNIDETKVWDLLSQSQGNWKDIEAFIKDNNASPYVLDFLYAVNDKDLRDTPQSFLQDHFENVETLGIKEGTPKSLLVDYVYSPLVSFELIRPWRSQLQKQFTKEEAKKYQDNPELLVDLVKNSIVLTDTENYYNCPISPIGVNQVKLADAYSRDIYFVALARSLGIPARLEPSTGRPQYFDKQWINAKFGSEKAQTPKGKITFVDDNANVVRPSYSTHYTVAQFDGNSYNTLNFRGDENLNKLPGTVEVDKGAYRLTIGGRANDGSVTVAQRFFNVDKGQNVTQKITIPKPIGLLQVQGIIDPNTIIELENGIKTTVKEQMFDKGVVLVFADPDKEPTKHILQDLPAVSEALNAWGGGIVFIVPDDKQSAAFDANAFKGLPEKATWAIDKGRKILNEAASALQIDFSNNFPLVLYVNTNGGIIYSHQGYTIGIGENILKTIDLEKNTK